MSAACANSEYEGVSAMPRYSQIANILASAEIRKSGNDLKCWISQNADMANKDDKNGGPNHLRAWMLYRDINGQKLASELGSNVTPGMVSDLANSKRALSAKWLRRLAPILGTTPGMLLDHDPNELPSDIVDIWINADAQQRRQLVDIAGALVRTGSNG